MTAALVALAIFVPSVSFLVLEVARDIRRSRDIKRAVRFARGEDSNGRNRKRD